MRHAMLYVALLFAAPAMAAEPAATASSGASVDARAVEALQKMGAYLRGLKHFSVHADSTLDLVTEDGQTLEFPGTVDYRVRAPDGLLAELKTDRKERRLFYDGRTLTLLAPRSGYYASVQAPGTIHELLATASDRYDIELPLADLFLWGTDAAPTSNLQSAMFVGPARIGGIATEQYAFRQQGVDWQVWIATGDAPLPRRLVITTTDDAARPGYAATLTWDTRKQSGDGDFTFVPDGDAKRIELVEVDATDATEDSR